MSKERLPKNVLTTAHYSPKRMIKTPESLMTEAMYIAAISAMNSHLPWYAKQADTPEVRAMILSVYNAVMSAK